MLPDGEELVSKNGWDFPALFFDAIISCVGARYYAISDLAEGLVTKEMSIRILERMSSSSFRWPGFDPIQFGNP